MTDKTPKKKAKNLVNTQAASAETTDTERVSKSKGTDLPSSDGLKARFKAGSIPLQTDFADMIDLASVGRQAVGGEETQEGPADGFILSEQGLLQLQPNEAKGISVDKDGVAVKVDNGIEVDQAGVTVKGGDGIEVNRDGVAVKAGEGIEIGADGVSLPLGEGLRHGEHGLDVKCKANGGLSASIDGTCVIPGQGITVDKYGVGVKAAGGIEVTDSGVSVRLSHDRSGLSVDGNNSLLLSEDAWIRTLCGLHGASFYVHESGFSAFFCNIGSGCVAYVYGRNGKYVSTDKSKIMLGNTHPTKIMAIISPEVISEEPIPHATKMIGWGHKPAASGTYFKCEVKELLRDDSSHSINLPLISAP